MKILIADDERPSRAELRFILEGLLDTAVYHTARNGDEALQILMRETIDVVFLDINMPGMSGLAVAAAIAERPSAVVQTPLVVFATAYDVHAVRAFELAAIDYVVKPFAEDRIAQTMQRVEGILTQRDQLAAKQTALQAYLKEQKRPLHLTKLWGERENESSALVDYKAILWIEAVGKQVHIRTTANETLRVWHTIKELEMRLASHGFVRIHKGYLLNLDHVAEVVKGFSGTYTVIINDNQGSRLPMSRQYGKQLREILRG